MQDTRLVDMSGLGFQMDTDHLDNSQSVQSPEEYSSVSASNNSNGTYQSSSLHHTDSDPAVLQTIEIKHQFPIDLVSNVGGSSSNNQDAYQPLDDDRSSLNHELSDNYIEGVSIEDKTSLLTSKYFRSFLEQELNTQHELTTNPDCIWRCRDGTLKVHKLVLAISSPFFQQIFSETDEDSDSPSVVYTPELSSSAIKHILSVFYTGETNIKEEQLAEVQDAFKLVGFNGQNTTIFPFLQSCKDDKSSIKVLQVKNNGLKKTKKKATKASQRKKQKFSGDLDSNDVTGSKSQGKTSRSCNVNTDLSFTKDNFASLLSEEDSSDGDGFSEMSTSDIVANISLIPSSKRNLDTRERFQIQDDQQQLVEDMCGPHHSGASFLFVCHICYSVFDGEQRLEVHKRNQHPLAAGKVGPYHTHLENTYRCPNCFQKIEVSHIVWFCKHKKYCGVDDKKALDIPGYIARVTPRANKPLSSMKLELCDKDTPDRLRITGKYKGKLTEIMSKLLVGKVVDFIWGCRFCYSVYLSQNDLDDHMKEKHPEDKGEGPYWSKEKSAYICCYCNLVQNCRHIVWFIYHLSKCRASNPESRPKKEENENVETDVDDDVEEAAEDDPDGIVLKPFRVSGEKAEWICQSLIGHLVDCLFPCHVCYNLFDDPELLRAHFQLNHHGMMNIVENGNMYYRDSDCFHCPVCNARVCHNQTTSVGFIYHTRKCSGEVFRLKKPCQNCNKEFDSYSAHMNHVSTNCKVRVFKCNLCGKTLANGSRLRSHIKYVHVVAKMFNCTKCSKSYKRKSDLLEHEEMSHSLHFNYSCEKCGKQFYGKKNLAIHMKTHYTEEEKQHVCNHCGYRFAKLKFLKNHLTKHSDYRQFACEICGARVKTKDTLKQHRKKLHNITTPLLLVSQIPKNNEMLASQDGNDVDFFDAKNDANLPQGPNSVLMMNQAIPGIGNHHLLS